LFDQSFTRVSRLVPLWVMESIGDGFYLEVATTMIILV
jgi:hypothetical protein